MMRRSGPDKHVWIELIAFDTEQDDLGVGRVLSDMGERPSLLSLLLSSAEFVHSHGPDDGGLIPTECTSYAARPDSVRGPRQSWTRARLRQLVRTLQDADVAVYFAVFDLYQYPLDGSTRESAWNVAHPELTVTDRTGGQVAGLLNPLKRLADGTLYQDVFVPALAAVFEYYGFDGLHGADGYTSPRLPLWRADFSDDMIGQFGEATGIQVPPADTEERATWIWTHRRLEWIEFIAARWTDFWQTVVTGLHAFGAKVMLNNAWTRDPFEAMYRYGVDYAALARIGIDRMVLETTASAVELIEEPTLPPLHGQLAAVMLVRAHVPDLPLSALTAVHDTFEQWDVVHTAPAMLERDLRTLTSVRAKLVGENATRPCIDTALFSLADGLDRRSWDRLDAIRRSCESEERPTPERGSGFTLLYDPAILRPELAAFARERVAHTHALLASLLRQGAVISAVAGVREHHLVSGPVLLLRPEMYEAALIDDIAAVHELVTLGPVLSADGAFEGSWVVAHRSPEAGDAESRGTTADIVAAGRPEVQDSWLYELAMNSPSAEIVAEAAALLRAPALGEGGPLSDPGASDSVQVMVGCETSGDLRVTLHNSDYVFRDATFRPTAEWAGAALLSESASLPLRSVDGAIVVRVPPKGVSAFRILREATP